MLLNAANEFEQRREISGRLQAARHLPTAVLINHPRRNTLPTFAIAQLKIFNVSTPELPHDGEQLLSKKRMKRIDNRYRTRVAGIITRRL